MYLRGQFILPQDNSFTERTHTEERTIGAVMIVLIHPLPLPLPPPLLLTYQLVYCGPLSLFSNLTW